MSKHIELGKRGERLAAHHLQRKKYQILERNWRFSRAEIDLIVRDGPVLVFVEVKTRSDDYMGKPQDFVSHHKQELLADAATVYMEQIGHEWEIRFDVVAILIRKGQPVEIEHFEDAFFPGW
ncbi:MAG: YraN family protein [Bacteroidota bacterium]